MPNFTNSKVLHTILQETLTCLECQCFLERPAILCTHGHAICEKCGIDKNICSKCDTLFVSHHHTLINNILELLGDEESFLHKLSELLKCPVCYRQIHKRCNVCINGHAVCRMCSMMTMRCPLCRSPYACYQDNMVQEILNKLTVRVNCINATEGCKEMGVYSDILDHEDLCRFKKFACLIRFCTWSGKCDEIGHHCENNHKTIILNKGQATLHHGKRIFMHREEFKTYWIMYSFNKDGVYIACQVHDILSRDFIFSVTLSNKNEEQVVLKQRVFDIRNSLLENINSKSCIHIPMQMVNKFGTTDLINCMVSITNKPKCPKEESLGSELFALFFAMNIIWLGFKISK